MNLVFAVIGVAPPQFIGVNGMFGPDFWLPAAMTEQVMPNEMAQAFSDRGKGFILGVGRLNRVSQAQRKRTCEIAANLAREYPAADEGRTAAVVPSGTCCSRVQAPHRHRLRSPAPDC